MKRFVCLGAVLLFGTIPLFAQEAPVHAGRVSVSVSGGPALSVYENAFSYRDQGRTMDLLNMQGSFAVGYDFSETFGLRLQAGLGKDAGACNTRETSAHGFYPYSFSHVNTFVDAVINLSGLYGNATALRSKVYAGLGGAHTYGFTDSGHPWQKVNGKNTAFGFRGGFIEEYSFRSGLGIFIDVCGEAYTDNYNGLKPSEEDQKQYEGYAGFPLDLRGIISFGLVYRFN